MSATLPAPPAAGDIALVSPSPVSIAEQVFLQAWREGFTADPDMTTSEWADAYRVLVSVSSAEAGRFQMARTPYMREIVDTLSPQHPAERVVLVGGAQIGKSEGGNNWLGRTMDLSPCAMMMVQPTVDMAENYSKERIQPMIVSTPRLAKLVMENRSRDGGNTLLVKKFKGGMLKITGANSAVGLRSTPIKNLFLDEIDGYPLDVDGEGDPMALAEARTTTFPRRKIYATSTPTLKGLSRIETLYLASDQRRYFVPCPHCGHFDWMRWASIDFRNEDPETTHLLCNSCGVLIEERYKTWMLAEENGAHWRATATGDGKTAGFHVSGLYSPLGWLSWKQIVAEFLAAKNDPPKLKVWVNTRLAETYEERGDSVDPAGVMARAERYPAEVPDGVGVLVASVDVQGDRLEWKVKGYGAGEESWLIAWGQIPGDPSLEATWLEVDTLLAQHFLHASGQKLRIECMAIDSGGHHTENVYRYARSRSQRRVFAVKGGNMTGQPLVGRPTSNNPYRARLYSLCVDTGKEIVYSRLRVGTPGPGYMHMADGVVSDEYAAQLTAEKAVRKYVRGRGTVRQWIKTRARNEALDLEVYCLAALHILGQPFIRSLSGRAAKCSVRVAQQLELASAEDDADTSYPIPTPPPARPIAPTRGTAGRRGGWVKGWRK